LALFAPRVLCWLKLTPCLPAPLASFQLSFSPQSSPVSTIAGSSSFPGAGPCACPVASIGLQPALNFRVFIKHTCKSQEAQPPPDYRALVELICSKDFPSESHVFFLILSKEQKSIVVF